MIMSVPNKWKATPCLFPGYKWCGPGCSGPGCPVNDVDCCCKYHDLCYEDYGSCRSCDEQFLDCLCSKANPYSLKGRQAYAMYTYMRLKLALKQYD
ncbi:phospholipase [Priestia megaterium]|uniref:phospholipase n=2 Tax=Priestia megaterium TaxID=1404 RepID=UPI0027E17CC0|nr:phospholipase [Priestia megaterium]